MELSIVIPAFNEAAKIARDVAAADAFLSSEGIAGEIIVVDDGSTDDTANAAQTAGESILAECIVERQGYHRGKGHAVRSGMLKTRGDHIMFADSGCCIPYQQVLSGLELIRSGQYQIAHASRKLDGCQIVRTQSLYRRLCSKLFHWFLIHDIKRLGNLTDTQCGFKIYNGDVGRELYSKSRIDGFMFDIEIILLAMSRGYTIGEFPVDWTCDPDSRLQPAHAMIRVLADLIQLKRQFAGLTADN